MEIIPAILIGIVQGLLEWLPISSSGQISVILMNIFNINPREAFHLSLTIHMGTALTAIIVFRNKIFNHIKEKLTCRFWREPIFLILLFTPLTSLLTGLPIFLILRYYLEKLNIEIVTSLIGIFLVVTGVIQLLMKSSNKCNFKNFSSLNILDSIILGLIQGFSVIPGISRSAITIACLLAMKYNGEDAITISFLASIPLSLAIGIYGLKEKMTLEIILGIMAAFMTGMISIKAMLTMSKKLDFPILLLALGLMMILQLAVLRI